MCCTIVITGLLSNVKSPPGTGPRRWATRCLRSLALSATVTGQRRQEQGRRLEGQAGHCSPPPERGPSAGWAVSPRHSAALWGASHLTQGHSRVRRHVPQPSSAYAQARARRWRLALLEKSACSPGLSCVWPPVLGVSPRPPHWGLQD